jgi:hypothetical protein
MPTLRLILVAGLLASTTIGAGLLTPPTALGEAPAQILDNVRAVGKVVVDKGVVTVKVPLQSPTEHERTDSGFQSELPGALSPLIEMAQNAFRRDLPELLKDHYREWVAYQGEEGIGFSCSKRRLYQECLRRP